MSSKVAAGAHIPLCPKAIYTELTSRSLSEGDYLIRAWARSVPNVAPALHNHPSINHHTANMGDSDSSLSSPPSTDDEMPVVVAPPKPAERATKKSKKNSNILTFFKHRSPSPPPRKRPASPPHELVPEDNPQIAVRIRRVNRVPSRHYSPSCARGRHPSTWLTLDPNSSL